ncbi:HPr family phosphocarrier protein [Collinsella tanakaei]|uniref:Phosphocarrier protein HPr n=1 Tax=Collinsella ihumii TaxID=1720204 RepID=A0A921LRB5_9ACTN|nr:MULTISPECIES: HPr family phosphocarrier protein [Collinsella]MBM6688700.1 HPr family phosphocarrier protein [Collinsella tanakaei]MBM6785960.1 HPr family phosphocarrier protein [Collinsella tanakaei]MBM6905739.1 HPr family phosphocarrier protein [Collinsella tanakaei]MCF6413172.1 HPr family phosphocarrier protein [Collinsella tanakaei]MDN0054775.1 HPr family phosphocarrier protein [Collinsella ihumii]
MYSEETTIVNATGLHARPASMFTKTASGFKSNVTVKKAGAEGDGVNAKSMLALMTQGLACGTTIVITADGEDEQEAVKALVELIESGCGE